MSGPLLTVSASPHLLGRLTVRSMYAQWLIALAPALLMGLYYFGTPGLLTVLLATVSAVATEALCVRLGKMPNRVGDLHAVVMGVLMGMVLPAGVPWWIPVVGGFLCIFLGKMIFGGIGAFPMNPVLVAWAALSLSWPEHMNAFYAPLAEDGEWEVAETFLLQLKNDISSFEVIELSEIWSGNVPGAIGATCSWAIIAGGLFLIGRRIIQWQIPVGALLGVLIMALVAAYTDERIEELGYESFAEYLNVAWYHLAAGGLMISAFFLGPEPVTSPMTPWGRLLFGLGIGFMTVIVRTWGGLVDGAFFGVLLMNTVTPIFDRIRPKVLGKIAGSR